MVDPKLTGEAIRVWREHPSKFVRDVFGVTPDAWQDEVLEAFPRNPRLAMQACKGPGKTTVEAWCGWNFLMTRQHPSGAAVSNSGDNLRDNLWKEFAKWRQQSKLIQSLFEWTSTRIFAKAFPETWFISARTFAKSADKDEQAQTLAGLHADNVIFIIDEAGDVPSSVLVAAEATLSSCKEGHILIGGNPTKLEGPLYDAATKHRAMWWRIEITGDPDNPKRASRVSIEWAREQIKAWGVDNAWVLVNVFGRFPPASLSALIGPDEVSDAEKRRYREGEFEAFARILGVDVARFGDDANVIFPRQGLQAFNPIVLRNVNGTIGAGAVIRKKLDWDVDAVFVDDTGGFGSSWIDNMDRLKHTPIGVHFSEKSMNARYANKRAEMYFDMIEWIKRGGSIPAIPELAAALTKTTYTFKGEQLILEPKESVKIKLGYSPDHADALALTFAFPVERAYRGPVIGKQIQGHQFSYDPLSRDKVLEGVNVGQQQPEWQYDPRR